VRPEITGIAGAFSHAMLGRGIVTRLATSDLALSFHGKLRERTREDHVRVDAAFSRFNLDDPLQYPHFLCAHARILPSMELALDPTRLLTGWCGRTDALLLDLHSLGHEAPSPVHFPVPRNAASRWGALYVIEGSRLGGKVLSSRLPPGTPKAYLCSEHPQGSWRFLLQMLDDLAMEGGSDWQADAIQAAKAAFDMFTLAADAQRNGDDGG
jgi:heme oxygenase